MDRRSLLKGSAAATGLSFFSFRPTAALAQLAAAAGGAAASVLGAPRLALVIGNDRYKDSPLKNPVNDARAISAELQASDFAVTTLLDASLADMRSKVDAFGRDLAKTKGVGVFYFAGHGIQLSWRNYLLPVDTQIGNTDEVPQKAVDLARLLDTMGKAGNPANIVILDACRNNPFGRDFRIEQKGLSQVDAPVGTLLAYATAPGNVAIDGEGTNGLYTEHLLKEMKVPDAKVEDIFKRVRLAVRRQSKGIQIPWESTSLEEDFYFQPPEELKKAGAQADAARRRALEEARAAKERDEAEKKRRFEAERDEWEKADASSDPAVYAAYLYRYPKGSFTELAQLRLDQLLARQGEKPVEVVNAPENPFSKGTVRANIAFKVGDTFEIRVTDLYTGNVIRNARQVVTSVSDREIVFNNGRAILDPLGNLRRSPDGRRFAGSQDQPLEYALGRKWLSRFEAIQPNGTRWMNEVEFRIVARESVTVPAGTFDCFRIEGRGNAISDDGNQMTISNNRWMAPDRVRSPIRVERRLTVYRRTGGAPLPVIAERQELVSYSQA